MKIYSKYSGGLSFDESEEETERQWLRFFSIGVLIVIFVYFVLGGLFIL